MDLVHINLYSKGRSSPEIRGNEHLEKLDELPIYFLTGYSDHDRD